MNRRAYLAGAGIALSNSLVGCLQAGGDPGSGGDENGVDGENGTDRENENGGESDDGGNDADELSIDGRLHNDAEEPRTFEIVVRNEDGEVRAEGEWDVEADATERVPAFGRPGETQTFDVSVTEAHASETLELDVESTPGEIDGYVDVMYARDGEIEIAFAPDESRDESETVSEEPRIDEPPYEIERPPSPDGPESEDEWNDEYLGEHMETEPSLDVDTLSVRRGVIPDHGLTDLHGEEYWVDVVATAADRDEVLDLDAADEETRDRLEAVDFDESVLVAVESGYGSGSVEHRWARVEDAADGLHLHGYYTDPFVQTDDITTRVSVLEVERPSDATLARVSLTVDEDRRVHFNSTEGVVTLED